MRGFWEDGCASGGGGAVIVRVGDSSGQVQEGIDVVVVTRHRCGFLLTERPRIQIKTVIRFARPFVGSVCRKVTGEGYYYYKSSSQLRVV